MPKLETWCNWARGPRTNKIKKNSPDKMGRLQGVVKARKEKEAAESQFAVLESEKTTLTKALEEAKAAKNEGPCDG